MKILNRESHKRFYIEVTKRLNLSQKKKTKVNQDKIQKKKMELKILKRKIHEKIRTTRKDLIVIRKKIKKDLEVKEKVQDPTTKKIRVLKIIEKDPEAIEKDQEAIGKDQEVQKNKKRILIISTLMQN